MDKLVLGLPWAHALEREWLVTDGRGGYASGTVVGPQTRRYHGLLVAALAPPLRRTVLLSKLEETLEIADEAYALSANEFYDGTVHPQGFEHLSDFQLAAGVPVWRYAFRSDNVEAALEKRIWMEPGPTTFVSYTLQGPAPDARLSLVPLCGFRDFHHEMTGSEDWRFGVEPVDSGVTVRAYAGATPYHLQVVAPAGATWSFEDDVGWWWRFLHRAERERGQECLEDLYAIGRLTCHLRPEETLVLAAGIEPPDLIRAKLRANLGRHPEARSAMRPAVLLSVPAAPAPGSLGTVEERLGTPEPGRAEDEFVGQLRRAAAQFLVTRAVPGEPPAVGADGVPEARTVLAGYHWFGDWGRDTMIALSGLALATGRFAEARAIVRAFARYVDRGMLPNRFPESGVPLSEGDYNTVDATLWYFHAIDFLDRQQGTSPPETSRPATSTGLVEELFPVLAEIIDWHVQGTRFGIRVDPEDSLLYVENAQLTWMDAKVGDWIVTPRAGKPVEIAALWHHALTLMEAWARRLGRMQLSAVYGHLRERTGEGLRRRFWYEWGGPHGYLYDVVDGAAGNDASLRPNQAIAVALPDCPLEPAQRQAVVDTMARQLWTPRGLRTLAPSEQSYRGRYTGDVWQRDSAYHQGTVWPWLLGPFVDAHLLVYRDPVAARRFLTPLRTHLVNEAGVGSISEIFDGDAPHAAKGCIAQAWSVAEVFRAWMATHHTSR